MRMNGSTAPKLQSDHPSDAHQVPKWVCDFFKVPSKAIVKVIVENAPDYSLTPSVPSTHPPAFLYHVLLEYFALYAADIDETIQTPKCASTNSASTNSASTNSASLTIRQITARLSALMIEESFTADLFRKRGSELIKDRADKPPKAEFRFGLGRAHVQIDGKQVCIDHTDIGPPVSVEGRSVRHKEIHLYAQDTETLKLLADEAFKWDFYRYNSATPKKDKYMLYTLQRHNSVCSWKKEGLKTSRSLNSIVLPDGFADQVLDDFRQFTADGSEAWYASHGLLYTRSYLFYGPSGTGKTSVIRAVASALGLPVCDLSLGMHELGNMDVLTALNKIPKPSILVVEDVDDLTVPSPSLLNALDGLISVEGVITVLTATNTKDFDDSLMRAGRISRQFEFKEPTLASIQQQFSQFYPAADKALSKRFATLIFSRKEKNARNFATVQELFIAYRHKSAAECVDSVDDFFSKFYPNGKNRDELSIYR